MSKKPKSPVATSLPETPSLKTLAGRKAGALEPGDDVQTAGRRMREHDAADWPVAEDRKLVGKVEEKNPDWQLGGHGHDPKSWRVGEIMSRELVFCFEDEDCAQARRLNAGARPALSSRWSIGRCGSSASSAGRKSPSRRTLSRGFARRP